MCRRSQREGFSVFRGPRIMVDADHLLKGTTVYKIDCSDARFTQVLHGSAAATIFQAVASGVQ